MAGEYRRVPRSLPAGKIKPGMITVDGIVIDVDLVGGGEVEIMHRSVTYRQGADTDVQVFGRVHPVVLVAIRKVVGLE